MMNKKVSTVAGIIIILAIVGAISISFLISSKQKEEIQNKNNVTLDNLELENKEEIKQNNEEKIIEKNKEEGLAMEEVSFCGKNYNVEKIVLNDIDVIKRIATLSQNNKYRICENINSNSNSFGENLPVKFSKQKSTDVDYKDGIYFLNITLQFKIDLNTNDIYILGGYAGEPTFIGKLK